jgi:putative nucleotidyltransferase with HDIG domain
MAPDPAQPHNLHRLPGAFDRLSALPALKESRDRLLKTLLREEATEADLVRAVESDLALTIAVLRAANHLAGAARPSVATVPEAVARLSPQGVHVLARRMAVVDFFDRQHGWTTSPDHIRMHAVAVQAMADRIAREVEYPERDELVVASLLHDVGKLVLMDAYPGYALGAQASRADPDARLHAERSELGIDHALVGGVLIRRWGLPDAIARSVERHHAPGDDHAAALVKLADMLVHYASANAVDSGDLAAIARRVRVDGELLRSLMYEGAEADPRPRHAEPCPLSASQLRVLRALGRGQMYRQIADELNLSVSTVRTHAHAIYRKLGVPDRAQAVLHASGRGWI